MPGTVYMLVFVKRLVLLSILARRNFWYEVRVDKLRFLGAGDCVLRFVLSDLSSNEPEEKESHDCGTKNETKMYFDNELGEDVAAE
jgi:hypothetical protein